MQYNYYIIHLLQLNSTYIFFICPSLCNYYTFVQLEEHNAYCM